MSSVVLDSREDVLKFLQILAEESVSSARETIEKDTQQEKTIGKMKMDSKTYDLSEQPEAADEDEVVDSAEEEEVDASVDEPSTEESLEVSLDSIISAVNQLRGGRSTGDLEIKDKLRTYFDRLDETERVALLTFLKAFSGILTGAMDGNSAPDPSDPPLGIAMSSDSDEEAAVEDDAGAEASEDDDEFSEDEFEFEEEEEEEDAEDTTPPIKAGETQELAEIRKRVRKLMSKR
jgi:hypothetical protein